MEPDKVIYTDGHDVVVTDSTFKVRNASYRLNGITKLSLWTIQPDRWPGVLLLLIGILCIVAAYMQWIPSEFDVKSNNGSVDASFLAAVIGGGLSLIGILVLALSKARYAVRIGTAEGEKNAVISRQREYIAQIVDALHSAFDLGHAGMPMASKK